jgi:hypothetical protein
MRAHTHTHAFTAGHEGDDERLSALDRYEGDDGGLSALDRLAAALSRHTSKCKKSYAHVCCRMLTYADAC